MTTPERSVEEKMFRSTEEITGALPDLGARSPEIDRKKLADDINGVTTPTLERTVEEIVEDVASICDSVEFLHGVPVQLPSQTKALLRGKVREVIKAERQKREEAVTTPDKGAEIIIRKLDGSEVRVTYWKESTVSILITKKDGESELTVSNYQSHLINSIKQ